MVKGYRREVVVLRGTDSDYIEEAYFVLRETAVGKSRADLVAEANKIISASKLAESGETRKRQKGKRDCPLKWFAAGVGTMFAVCGTLLLILL